MEATQAAKVASREHYVALKNKKEELEQIIEDREAELRRLIIEEAKLTGIVPDNLTEEEKSTLPKQMATAYTLQHLVETIRKDKSELSLTLESPEEDKELKRLTRDFEIQCSIVKAEYKIYKENYTSKKIRKHRKKNYKNSEKKLKQIELELEKRREAVGISTRHSRFYSQVSTKEDFNWNVQSMSSKSMTLPSKQKNIAVNNVGKLSAVNENQVSLSKVPPRHSSAIPGRIDPSMIRNRQFKYNPTVFKKSNGSDSLSTASPQDGSSFLSLYSKDSSHISSCSLTSDDDRCLSCPATELLSNKLNHIANGTKHNQRVSQHLDLALPTLLEKGKKEDQPIDNLNLDMPTQVIFRPSTRYPKYPPTSTRQSPAEFYARSLPVEDAPRLEVNGNAQPPIINKSHFTSDQISKQNTDQRPTYTQHNSHNAARDPVASVPANSASTRYPMSFMRVNSVPYELSKSKSRSQEFISYPPPQTLTSPRSHNPSPNYLSSPRDNIVLAPYNYGGNSIYSNNSKQAIPIARIHTTPANITTLDYSKPTHYPQTKPSSPNLREDRRGTRSPQTGEPRVRSQQYGLHGNMWYPQLQPPRVLSPATTRYIPPNYRQSEPCVQEHTGIPPGQYARYKSPYNHQIVPPLNLVQDSRTPHKYYIDPSSPYPPSSHLLQQPRHDALAFTHSLPLSPSDVSPGIRNRINYWENQNSTCHHMEQTQSMEQIVGKGKVDFSPGPHKRQSMNVNSASTPNNYRKLINSDGFQYQCPMGLGKSEFVKELLPSPEEGTPV